MERAAHQHGAAAISAVDGSGDHRDETVRAVRTERYKLVEASMDGTEVLFDLAADGAEQTDLRARNPELARQVRAFASDRRGPAVGTAASIAPGVATRERLRALGYEN